MVGDREGRRGRRRAGSQTPDEPVAIKVASLKGPTSIGIASLMDKANKGETQNHYDFKVASSGYVLDILAIMGAHSQYFAYQNVRLMKEMRNEANRKANQAATDKKFPLYSFL